MLLSSGETDGRLDGAVVPQSFQDATQPYCVPFPTTDAERSHQNTELNVVETGSNSDIVHASSEHVPVSAPVPQLLPKRIILRRI